MHAYLDFERPIAELEGKIVELRQLAAQDPNLRIDADVSRLQYKADALIRDIYTRLTPWQRVQVARHPGRPHFSDYAAHLFEDFTPLAGDRAFAEDAAAALRLTAQDLLGLGVIDAIVPEPVGGAHRGVEETIANVGEQISRALGEMSSLAPDELRRQRRDKYLAMGRDLAK